MIKRLLLLNGLAAVGVVLNHAAGWGYTTLFWWTDRYISGVTVPNFDQVGSLPYYGLRTIEQLIAFSIAAFLVVSGFFIAFAARRQATLGWHTVRSRIWTLLIPYLLWSGIIFLGDAVQGDIYTPAQYARRLLTGQVISGYYYVPMLCQLLLLAPLLVRLAQRSWKSLLAIAAVIQLGVQLLLYLDTFGVAVPDILMIWTQSWLFPGNLLWFALGIVIGFNLSVFKIWVHRVRWRWLVTAFVLIPLGIIEWEVVQMWSGQPFLPTRLTFLDSIYAAAVIFTLLAFENVSPPFTQSLGSLGSKSFGVYLTHVPVLGLTARLIAFVVPVLLAYQVIFQPILWVVGLGAPLLLMRAAGSPKSPIRRYYQYLFG